MLPNNIPILNHILFKGVRIFEFNILRSKKTIEIIKDQYLISLPFNKGQIAIIKKTVKKNNTKTFI